MEGFGDVDRLLAERPVDPEQDLVGCDHRSQAADLLDQAFVDLEPARGVKENGIGAGRLPCLRRAVQGPLTPIAGTSFDSRSA